ncbi:MAG: CoB--CoM heterodisulfide reductase iron-sulfur subunit B family protein [Thermodesulfobacteriota bacterium]|nr:CoB--CoM heterodisulfide reductase iron-sulfur subunit B family protein [Thermodesulfobacteriota bacterium]
MRYLYYPGCSLEGTAREYDISTRALMQALGVELLELEDWTCCGASAAEPTSRLLSLVLPARNLALAERTGDTKDILAPCSACYLNLKKVEEKTRNDPGILSQINLVLLEDRLELKGTMRVRHILDIITNDIGVDAFRPIIRRHLNGLTIAPYYGCQCLRPYPVFDDPEKPKSMEPIIDVLGAKVHTWGMGGKCCGASHMSTKMGVGIELVAAILKGAKGADAIVTVCPMCQINLEAYQRKISRIRHEDLTVTVLYLPQLVGLALGLPEQSLALDLNLSLTEAFRDKLSDQPHSAGQ